MHFVLFGCRLGQKGLIPRPRLYHWGLWRVMLLKETRWVRGLWQEGGWWLHKALDRYYCCYFACRAQAWFFDLIENVSSLAVSIKFLHLKKALNNWLVFKKAFRFLRTFNVQSLVSIEWRKRQRRTIIILNSVSHHFSENLMINLLILSRLDR